jgi:hypothetical protein
MQPERCPAIPGGYILKARKALTSAIMDKPPLWAKLWDWMLLKASHRDHGGLRRGQFVTTLEEARRAMSWRVGYRIEAPSLEQVRSALEGLAREGMVATARARGGTLVTVCNYAFYQDPKNYEAHPRPGGERPAKTAQAPEQKQDSGEPSPQDLMLPLADGPDVRVPAARMAEWQEKYRFLDVSAELHGLAAWFNDPGERGGAGKRWPASRWFFALVAWLGKKNRAAVAKAGADADPGDPDGSRAAARRRQRTDVMLAELRAKRPSPPPEYVRRAFAGQAAAPQPAIAPEQVEAERRRQVEELRRAWGLPGARAAQAPGQGGDGHV